MLLCGLPLKFCIEPLHVIIARLYCSPHGCIGVICLTFSLYQYQGLKFMCEASNPVVVKVHMPPPLPPPPSPMQEKNCKLDALRLLLRPFVGAKLPSESFLFWPLNIFNLAHSRDLGTS